VGEIVVNPDSVEKRSVSGKIQKGIMV